MWLLLGFWCATRGDGWRVADVGPLGVTVRTSCGLVRRVVCERYLSFEGSPIVAADPTGHRVLCGHPVAHEFSSGDVDGYESVGYQLTLVDVDSGVAANLGGIDVDPGATRWADDGSSLTIGDRTWTLGERP